MRYLGIDYGLRRIGLALSDVEGMLAFPHATVSNDAKALAAIVDLVQKEGIGHVVIGDTRAQGGGVNEITEAAEAFTEALAQAAKVPVDQVSEAWSSYEAGRFAPKGEHDDAAAAAIILQRYLDMKR